MPVRRRWSLVVGRWLLPVVTLTSCCGSRIIVRFTILQNCLRKARQANDERRTANDGFLQTSLFSFSHPDTSPLRRCPANSDASFQQRILSFDHDHVVDANHATNFPRRVNVTPRRAQGEDARQKSGCRLQMRLCGEVLVKRRPRAQVVPAEVRAQAEDV